MTLAEAWYLKHIYYPIDFLNCFSRTVIEFIGFRLLLNYKHFFLLDMEITVISFLLNFKRHWTPYCHMFKLASLNGCCILIPFSIIVKIKSNNFNKWFLAFLTFGNQSYSLCSLDVVKEGTGDYGHYWKVVSFNLKTIFPLKWCAWANIWYPS